MSGSVTARRGLRDRERRAVVEVAAPTASRAGCPRRSCPRGRCASESAARASSRSGSASSLQLHRHLGRAAAVLRLDLRDLADLDACDPHGRARLQVLHVAEHRLQLVRVRERVRLREAEVGEQDEHREREDPGLEGAHGTSFRLSMPSWRDLKVPPARPGVLLSTTRCPTGVARVGDEPERIAGLAGLAVGAARASRSPGRRTACGAPAWRPRPAGPRPPGCRPAASTRCEPSEFAAGCRPAWRGCARCVPPATVADWCVPSGLKK